MTIVDAKVSRYRITIRSAGVPIKFMPATGRSAHVTRTLATPSIGARRNHVLFDLRGMIVSLPRHFR